jgi:hypothetical protein
MSDQTSSDGGDWLTVSQAAARLGVSERAIQKRCNGGKIKARRTVTPQGTRWEIDPNEITRTTERTPEPNEPIGRERTNEPPNQTPEHGSFAVQIHPNQRTEPPEQDANRRTEPSEREAEMKAEIQFLRGMVEAQNRDAAEMRAALRAALALSQKALTEGTQSTLESAAIEAPQRDEIAPPTEGLYIGGIPPTIEAKAPKYFERSKGLRAWLLKALRG